MWLADNIQEELKKEFLGERTGWVKAGGFTLPSKYEAVAHEIRSFQAKPDDIWVVTFPRSGTTMTQEMVWIIANDFNFEKAKKTRLAERFPFFELGLFMHDETKAMFLKETEGSEEARRAIEEVGTPMWRTLADAPGPRFIKSHLPPSILPSSVFSQQSKVIYVARNPKDVAVSYYHLSRLWRTTGYIGTFEKFWDYFERGLVGWGPYWRHIEEGWRLRNEPNTLFMFYEEMTADMGRTVRKVAAFLGKETPDKEVAKLVQHLDVSNFKRNPAVNCEELRATGILSDWGQRFIRNGKTGGDAAEFSGELKARANRWIEENYKKTQLRFPIKARLGSA